LARLHLLSNGVFKIGTIGALNNATSNNIQVDEQYSARPVFQFTNQTGTSTNVNVDNGTMMVVDTKTTMQTLLNSN